MSVIAAVASDLTHWSPRGTQWLVFAGQAGFILPGAVLLGLDVHDVLAWPPHWGGVAVTLPLAFGLLALQLRLSLSFAARKPTHAAPWLLVGMLALIYVPMLWIGFDAWFWMQVCLMAAVAMVLPRWPAVAVVTAIVIGSNVVEFTDAVGFSTFSA